MHHSRQRERERKVLGGVEKCESAITVAGGGTPSKSSYSTDPPPQIPTGSRVETPLNCSHSLLGYCLRCQRTHGSREINDCEPLHDSARLPVPRVRRQDPRLRVEPTPSFSVICACSPLSQATHGSGSNGKSRRSGDGGKVQAASESSYRSATAARRQGGTAGFTSVSGGAAEAGQSGEVGVICVDVVCPYTRALVVEGLARRRGGWRVTTDRWELCS